MLLRTFLLSVIILGFVIHHTDARGVLTIRLLNFENHKGRTYDGSCCDQTPDDSNTCPDQCDYVMRLIISGLGRANDHVFLFHRPLKYDANDISFQEEGTDMVLTILFDEWPNMGHVKMNVFFYDYDDYDHTTLLVDWFENELKRTVEKGHYQKSQVQGNRQSDKTLLEFEWSVHCFTANDCLKPPPEWKSWPWDRKEQETQSGLYIPKSTSEKTPPPSTTLELTNESQSHQWKNGKWRKSHNNDEVTRSDFDVPAIGSRDEKFRNVRRKGYGTPEKTTPMYEGIKVNAVTDVAVAAVAADSHRSWPASQDIKGRTQHQGNVLKSSIKSGTKVNRHGYRNPYTRPSDGQSFVKTDTPSIGNHAKSDITTSSVHPKSHPTSDVDASSTHSNKGKTKSGLAMRHGIPPFKKPNENDSSAREQDVRHVASSSTDASMGPTYYSTSGSKQPISRMKTVVPNARTSNDASTNRVLKSSEKPVDRSTISTAPTRRNPYKTFKTASWKWIHQSSTETSTVRLPHPSSKPQGAAKPTPSYKKNDNNHTARTILKKPVNTASRKKSDQVKKAKAVSVKKSPWRKPSKSVKQPKGTSDVTVKKLYFPKDKWQTQSATIPWNKKHEILTPTTKSYFWHASTTNKQHNGPTRKPNTVTSYRDQYTTRIYGSSPSKPRRTASPTVSTKSTDQRGRFSERKRKYFGGTLKNRYQLMHEAENENRGDKAKPMVRFPPKMTKNDGSKSTHDQSQNKPKQGKTKGKAIPAVVVGLIPKQTLSTQKPRSEHDSRTTMSTKITQSIRKNASRKPFQPWSKSSVTEKSEHISTTQNAITLNIARKTLKENVRKMQTSSPPSVQEVTRRAFQSWTTSRSTKPSFQTHQTTTKPMKSTSSVHRSGKFPSESSTFKPTVKIPTATKTSMKPITEMKKKQRTPPKSTVGSRKNARKLVRPTVRPLTDSAKSPFAPVKPTKQTDLQNSMLKELKSMVQSNMKKMIPDDINMKIGQHTMTSKHTTLSTSSNKSPFKPKKGSINNYETSTHVYSTKAVKGNPERQTTMTVAVTPSRSAAWTHFTQWWQRPKTFTTLPPLKVLPAGVNEGKVLHVVDEYRRRKMKQPKTSHSPVMKVGMSSRSKTTAKPKAKVNRFVRLRSTTMSHPTHATTRTTNQPKTTQRGMVNQITKKPVTAPKNAAAGVTASASTNVHKTDWNRHKGSQLDSTKVPKGSKPGTAPKGVTKMNRWNPFTKKPTRQLTTSSHTTTTPQQGNTKRTRLGMQNPGAKNKAEPIPVSKQITDKHNRMTGHPTASSPKWGNQKPVTKKSSPVESPFKKKALTTPKAQIPKYSPTTRLRYRKPSTIIPMRTHNRQGKVPSLKSNVKKPLSIKTFDNRHTTTAAQFALPRNTRKWRYMTGEKTVHKEKTTNIWEGLMSTRIITSRRTIPMGPAPTQKTPIQLKNLNRLKEWERQNQSKKTKTVPQAKQNDNARQKKTQNPHGRHVTRRNYAPTRSPVFQSTSRKVTSWWQRRTSTAPQTLRTTTANPSFRKFTLPPSVDRSTRWWKRINRIEAPRTTPPAIFDGTSTKSSGDRDIVYTLRPTRWWRRVKTTTQPVSSTNDGILASRLTTIPTHAPTRPWQRRKGKDKSTVKSNSGRKSAITTPHSKNGRYTRYTGRPTRFWQRRTTTVNIESESVTKQANAKFSKYSTRSGRSQTSTQSTPTSRSTSVVTPSIFTPKTTQIYGRYTRIPTEIQKTSPSATKRRNTNSPFKKNEEKNKTSKSKERSTIATTNGMDSTPEYDTTTRTSQAKSWQQKKQVTTRITTRKSLTNLRQGRTQHKYPLTSIKPETKSWQRSTQRKPITTTAKLQTKSWQRRTKTNHAATTAKPQTKSWQRRTKTNHVVTTAMPQTKSWQQRTKTNHAVTTTKPQTKSWQRRTKTNHVVITTKPQTKSWQRRTKTNHVVTTAKPQTKSWQRRTKTNHAVTTTKPQTKSWQRRTKTNHVVTTTKPQTKSWQRRTKTNHVVTTTKPQTKSWQRRTKTNHVVTTAKPQTKSWQRRTKTNHVVTTAKPQTKSWQRRTKTNHIVSTTNSPTKSSQQRKRKTTSVVPQTKSWQRRKPTTTKPPQTRSVTVKKLKHLSTSTSQSATKWWERRRTKILPGTTVKTHSRNSVKSVDQTSDYLTRAKHMWTTMPLPDAKKDRGVVTTSKIETTDKTKGWNIFEFLPEILSKMYNGQSVEEMKNEKTSSAAAGTNPNPKYLLKSTPKAITTRPLIVGNHVTKKTELKSREKSKILKTLMPTTGQRDGRSTITMHQQTASKTSTLPTNRGRKSSTTQQKNSTVRPKDTSEVKQKGINHTTDKGEVSTRRKAIKTTTPLSFKKQTSTERANDIKVKTTENIPHVTPGVKISTTAKTVMASLSTTTSRTRHTTDKLSTTKEKTTPTVTPPSKMKTTLSSILKTTTKPVKINLTLPNWISFPTKKETSTKSIKSKKSHKGIKNNKMKNNQKKKTQSKPKVAPTKKVTSTKKTPPKISKGKPAKPKVVKKNIDLKTLMKKKVDGKKKSDVKKKVNAKTRKGTKKKDGEEIGINVSIKKPVGNKIDTKKKIISRKIVPRPTVTLLNKTSDKGPRVIVPNDGLFVPGPTKIVKIVTSQKDENGTITEEEVFVAIPSNSEAQQIGLQVKRLNIQTVFNRYWPAILGLTIGTVFLVAAVLTSVACRAQRLYVQRSRYNDQPQHLTEPPDTSEYSSSAASLVSDATRSSIRL